MQSSSSGGTANWSSRSGFILAAVGSSVGLGNLWRFSAEAGANGGAAFIVVYLACVFFIGIPIIMSELLIGRAGKAASAIKSAEDLARRSKVSGAWSMGIWLGVISSFLILSFYAVVAAWVLAYIPKFLNGAFNNQTPVQIAAQFDSLTTSPGELMPWYLLICVLTIWLVARGVNRGIEMAAKILMPSFFVLLLILAIVSVWTGWTTGGTQLAFSFMFSPDISKIDGNVAVSALGQAFFSLGIGMAMIATYGSYLPKNVNIPQSALIIVVCDTLVALIAGFAIFPIVFTFGLDFTAGAGLFFQTLPTALINTSGGSWIGAAFFSMAFFAALTTAVAFLEPAAAYVTEQFGLTKARSAIIIGIAVILFGLASLYSLAFMDFLDTGLTAPILLPLSALLVVFFTGWRLDRRIIAVQVGSQSPQLAKFLFLMLRYVAPIMILVIMISGIYSQYFK